MKASTFDICTNGKNGKERRAVRGYVADVDGMPIGIHKDDRGAWTVTHIPTGYAIGALDYDRRSDAIAAAADLVSKLRRNVSAAKIAELEREFSALPAADPIPEAPRRSDPDGITLARTESVIFDTPRDNIRGEKMYQRVSGYTFTIAGETWFVHHRRDCWKVYHVETGFLCMLGGLLVGVNTRAEALELFRASLDKNMNVLNMMRENPEGYREIVKRRENAAAYIENPAAYIAMASKR